MPVEVGIVPENDYPSTKGHIDQSRLGFLSVRLFLLGSVDALKANLQLLFIDQQRECIPVGNANRGMG